MLRQELLAAGIHTPENASVSDWLQATVSAEEGSVESVMPRGYEAYARIFHPARSQMGDEVRWERVAECVGRTMHPLVQWHTLVGSANPDELSDSEWQGDFPQRGSLEPETWGALCDLLSKWTALDQMCVCAHWTGRAPLSAWLSSDPLEQEAKGSALPCFSLPPFAGRDYLLVITPLGRIRDFAVIDPFVGLPNFIWPMDQAWMVGSDIDFDSTLIGGSKRLVRSILDSQALEAWKIQPQDSLAFDADKINSTN